MNISAKTQLLGIIGHPISHSLSPLMHNASFVADNVDYAYVAMDVPPERLEYAVAGLASLGYVGFNVTMPHKESIIPFMDELDETARISGAVNTVIIRDTNLFGMNTDGSGFIEACKESGVEFAGKKALLLGAGGAAASIAVAVLGENLSSLTISNRTVSRAENLADKVRNIAREASLKTISLEAAARESVESDIIINTTYLGMKGYDSLPIPAEVLRSDQAVCDAVYLGESVTELIRRGLEVGARTVSGDRMLLYQGVQAQRIWTGREPNVEVMSNVLTK